MKHGGSIARTKQRCRIIVYIVWTLIFIGLVVNSLLTNHHQSEQHTQYNGYKFRRLLAFPQFENLNGNQRQQQKSVKSKYSNNNQTTATSTTTQTTAQTTAPPTTTQTTATSTTSTTLSTIHTTPTTGRNSTDNNTTTQCEIPSVFEFPRDLFTQSQRSHGAFLVHVFISCYMFFALAIVCDYYFVPSLEVICYKFQLQTDVAGASLMAIGSSAPELFASIIGVFITKGDIGIGTILGSAIFNVLFVLGMCGLLSTTELQLAWWPLMRDGLCYAFSLIILAIVIVDGEVGWLEAAFMLLMYALYLILMWKNSKIERAFYLYTGNLTTYEERFEKLNTEEAGEDEGEHHLTVKERMRHCRYLKIGTTGNIYTGLSDEDSGCSSEESIDAIYPDEEPRKILEIPPTIPSKIYWAFTLIIYGIFHMTIPDIRHKSMRRYVGLTFLMSIVWIGLTTYIMVWMMSVVGFTFSIPDAVMGLTFIAFGSSVPDALASILVARQGKGDMAVSQAMGSNVFDILLGLGLPWLLKTLIFDRDSTIEVQSVGMMVSCFSIFLSVISVLIGLYYYDFKLTKKIGVALVIIYAFFLLISVLLELFLWSGYHLPTCKYKMN